MSLCQICAQTIGTCSWERDFTPVPGWEAKPTTVLMQSGVREPSYRVLNCPLYVPPGKGRVAEGGRDAPRPILAIHMETGNITRYPSIKQAEKQGGFQSSAIYRCLRGEAKYHKQHYFRESKAL